MTVLFITTAVRTSNHTGLNMFNIGKDDDDDDDDTISIFRVDVKMEAVC
jgi:hypothetical protein